MITKTLLKRIYKKRQAWSHKGDYGKLLVVGGSLLYSGSPMLNALAAYRSGCDLVRVAAPESAADAIKSFSPDLIAFPLKGDCLSKKHVKAVMEMQKDADAMVIGGGLGRSKETLSAIRSLLKKTKIPAVIDADAIHAISDGRQVGGRASHVGRPNNSRFFRLNKNFVLTPHTYEFYKLSGKKVGNDIKQRSDAAKDLVSRLNCVVLLKGHVDVVSDEKRTATNTTGNPFMTKGGFGDTLAGICGALLARGIPAFDAACAAAYINGRAGDLAAKKFGESVMASDLIWDIPNAIK